MKTDKGAKKKKKNPKFKLAYTNRKAAKDLANSASNELAKEDLSGLTDDEKLQLSSWGLPSQVLNNYRSKGITSLFPWQLDCLANERVLEGKNLLYSAPTSAGKTLVSEILMIKRVRELGRKAIMILPFVSVAREKVYSLQGIFGDAGIRVEGFMGSVNPPGGFKAVDIAVCTIEKANSLINKLLEEDALTDLGTLVVDELHLIGDPHRGYLLELLLTKILYCTSIKNKYLENSMSMNMSEDGTWRPRRYHIQIIGMSATLPNLDVLAKWINAELYITDFRPVPLRERLKIENKLYDDKLEAVREVKIESVPVDIKGDMDDIVYLSLETVLHGFSVLIFCPTKALVEKTAEKIAREFFRLGNPSSDENPVVGERLRAQLNGNRIKTFVEQLRQCPGGADEVLTKTVMFGIGYHHAGLTYENRDLVESAFKRGILKVIVATSTLSAGVNLPARRVMIVTPIFNGSLLNIMVYRQMCGRAGRNGIDTEGESILICPSNMKDQGIALFKGPMPLVRSTLLGDGSLTSSMKRALLEVVASNLASSPLDVKAYAKTTFLFHSIDAGLYASEELPTSQANKEDTIEECLQYLESQDFIRLKRYEDTDKSDYMPTQLGSACLASSLSPDDGIIVYKELLKARECFVLENELHVIYQVTPIYVSDQLRNISWMDYLKIWENLDVSEKKVATLVGIQESFIIKAMIGTVSWRNPAQREDMAIHQRFFAALALSDLVNEKSLDVVSKKFGLNKGILQNLQQAASTFAGMVTAFCGRLGWSNLELLLSQFQERLEFGVQRELCDLVRLECLNGQRARILYDAGLKSVMDLAATDSARVEQILHRATPFKSAVHGGRESTIWMIGKETLTEAEAAQKIVNEARLFIQIEHGQLGNIQFAFGNNDTPQPTSDHPANNSTSENGNTEESFSIETDLEELQPKSSSNKNPKSPLVELPKDNMEDVFSQRHLEELENNQLIVPETDDLENSQDLFEDSFPEIIAANLSALYTKSDAINTSTRREEGVRSCNYSTESMSEKLRDGGVQKTSPPRFQRCEEDGMTNFNQNSTSTPVSLNNHRSTFRDGEQSSPISSSQLERCLLLNGSTSRDTSKPLFHEIPEDMMVAMLDSNFDSVDTISEDYVINPKRQRICSSNDPAHLPGNKESLRLSESDIAAMQALAEESNYESEELFQVESDVDCPNSKDAPPNLPSSETDFDEEDFILTQGPVVTEEADADQDMEMFESSDTCTMMDESISGSNDVDSTILEENVGKIKLTTRFVQSEDAIPSSFFKGSEPVLLGVGIKLVSQKKSSSISKQGIGARILGKKQVNHTTQADSTHQQSMALYNGGNTIWVLRWEDEETVLSVRRTQARKSSEQVGLFKLLSRLQSQKCCLALFDSKEKIKMLVKHCGSRVVGALPPGERIWDPRIAQWILEFDDDEWNISKASLIDQYVEEEDKRVSRFGWDKEIVEAYLTWKVMTVLKRKLMYANMWNHFTTVEMPSTLPLLLMEINGFGLDSNELSKLKRILQYKSALLELRAFQMAGHQFNLGSPKDIKQVLYRDIGLKQPRGKGTGKDVLLKLDHELPGIIVEWRKVTSALQKVVIPFQQERNLETGRVHGQYNHFTVTGRVVMSDPSLQCIPRDFDIEVSYDADNICELKNSCQIKFGSKLASLFQQLDNNSMMDLSTLEDISMISMRNVFVPCSKDFTLLTADYSQLELRILAHLCKDENLMKALNRNTDVFVEIASQWKQLPRDEITSSMRQEAKGIVYGVIYGMGIRTLSEQMEIEEREAAKFVSSFMQSYPGINRFLDTAVKDCLNKGYVETMTGRRRHLPHIRSRNPNEKAKASRQAVNSKIQGSAADLVKAAMGRIHKYIAENYPQSSLPVEWQKVVKARRSSMSSGPASTQISSLVCIPILNLHDELIFEVRKTHLDEIARVIKREMESCVTLSVKLPVVIKTGETWGSLSTFDIV